MTAREQVQVTRRWIVGVLVGRALLWGVFASLAALVSGMLAVGGLPTLAALIAGVGVAAVTLWKTSWPREDWRVALWVEEIVPSLQFRLVSATDPACEATWSSLESTLPSIPWSGLRRRAAWNALRWPAFGAIIATLAILAIPVARSAGMVPQRGIIQRALPPAGIGDIRVRVTQPAYAGGESRSLSDPTDIAALTGSTVEVTTSGRTAPAVQAGDKPVRVSGSEGRWRFALIMPSTPQVIRLSTPDSSRLMTLTPRQDSVPQLTIRAPALDTTLRDATGRITLSAIARDDIGIVLGGFEYIVSSGSGESFTFKSGMLGIARFSRARETDLHAVLDARVLGLGAGDVVHVRAVASDGLAPGGPDAGTRWRGSSETRVIRVARADEYDSVAVEGAPSPDIEGALSQRMLLMLTEELEKRRPRLRADTVRAEARRIAVDQSRLRKRVGTIIFSRLGGGGDEGEHSHEDDERLSGPLDAEELLARASEATESAHESLAEAEGDDSPVVAINRPLLEAYNHMWDAQRALEVGTPARAIAPMRAAIAALQRARAAERIYLRGRPPVVVVDVDHVRMSGKDRPESPAARSGRESRLDERRVLARRIEGARALLAAGNGAGLDSILVVRLAALEVAPEAAAALARAADALRAGKAWTGDLQLARRSLLGEVVRSPLGSWGSGQW